MVEIVYIYGDVSFAVLLVLSATMDCRIDHHWLHRRVVSLSPSSLRGIAAPSSLRGMAVDGRLKLMMRVGGGYRRWLLQQIQSLELSLEEEGGTSRFTVGDLSVKMQGRPTLEILSCNIW
jgi:hypothetical protein